MLIDRATSSESEAARARARALRDEYARTAAICAYQIEKARARSQAAAVARWTVEYRRSTATCRLLGEIVRGEQEAA